MCNFQTLEFLDLNIFSGYFRNWGQCPEDTKRTLFYYKKVKKGTLNLTPSPPPTEKSIIPPFYFTPSFWASPSLLDTHGTHTKGWLEWRRSFLQYLVYQKKWFFVSTHQENSQGTQYLLFSSQIYHWEISQACILISNFGIVWSNINE